MPKLLIALVGAMLWAAPATASTVFSGTFSYGDTSLIQFGDLFSCCDEHQEIIVPPLFPGHYTAVMTSANQSGLQLLVETAAWFEFNTFVDGGDMGSIFPAYGNDYISLLDFKSEVTSTPGVLLINFWITDPSGITYYPDGNIASQTYPLYGGDGGPFGTALFVPPPSNGDTSGTYSIEILSDVPEPTAWAMMLAGFSVLGFAIRKSAKREYGAVA